MKYEFTGQIKTVYGVILRQIRAVVAFGDIAAGTVGGWIEHEENLSQNSGNAWVADDACVFENARIAGNAQIYGNTWVYGTSGVSDRAQVYDNARVFGDAYVCNDARIFGNAWIFGNPWVSGKARIFGKARVYGQATVRSDALVSKALIIATRSDSYTFAIFEQAEGPLAITAGCRFFTIPEAREHWAATRGGTQLGDESLAIVDHLERMAKIQGLKDNTPKGSSDE